MELFIAVVVTLVVACHGLPTGENYTGTPCICTKEYMPVCGVNGKTYSNKCAMDCEGVELSHTGECKVCMCPRIYKPTCGQDGKTYANQCEMNCAGVELSHTGECKVCMCPRIYKPTCGQDGKTYANQCEMNCAGVALFQDGVCPGASSDGIQKRADKVCPCFFIYLPVCGSDGKTYGNQCALDCQEVSKVKDGPCDGELATIKP